MFKAGPKITSTPLALASFPNAKPNWYKLFSLKLEAVVAAEGKTVEGISEHKFFPPFRLFLKPCGPSAWQTEEISKRKIWFVSI